MDTNRDTRDIYCSILTLLDLSIAANLKTLSTKQLLLKIETILKDEIYGKDTI